ncbi:plasmid stabilization protein [Labrys miyagiensis]|uniref:Plasmid stabilization protein n=1 Tax=Labrys miyagiensis TaxID=346912 RepID=A0ABQ6CDE3_9HYPH|nr:type II toxin-antitoxin system RelE/ParE family toxin [Labrys miyagiensis]GLS18286.1 plasmid stabilization protein [Labrys miyagiensis]
MRYRVVMADEAEADIEDIYRYIARHDSITIAERVMQALDDACHGLGHMPLRGNVPKELISLGISEYREAHYKPFRIIYRVIGADVVIYCVVDGRRDMRAFLERRLLRQPR